MSAGMQDAAPEGDLVLALAASPDFARDGVCFAARQSGLYRSDDGGATWRSAYDTLALDAPLPTTAVALSPDFAADRGVFAGVQGAVLRSHDGGATWFADALPAPPPVVSALVVSPDFARDGVVLAGTLEDGVLRSADRGGSWSAWNFGLLDLGILALAASPDFARDETLFAGTATGLFRSTNGGRAWREVEPAGEFAPILSMALSPRYADDGVIVAGTEANGVWVSADRGGAWRRLGGDLAEPVNAILLARDYPATPRLLLALDAALRESRDGGRTWAEWPVAAVTERGLTAIAAPRGLVAGAPLLLGLADGSVLRLPIPA